MSVRLARRRTAPSPAASWPAHVTYGLLVSRNGGRRLQRRGQPPRRGRSEAVRLRGRRANVLVATACDGNGNCGVKRLGRFKAGR